MDGWRNVQKTKLVSGKRKKGKHQHSTVHRSWKSCWLGHCGCNKMFMLWKSSSDKQVPWRQRRRLGMGISRKANLSLSCLTTWKEQNEQAVATKRVYKNLQRGRSGGEGRRKRNVNTSQKRSRETVQSQWRVFFPDSTWGRRPYGLHGCWMVSILQIVCTLEFERSTDRDEGFLELKEAQANEQYKNIISVLGAAAPKWEFDNI